MLLVCLNTFFKITIFSLPHTEDQKHYQAAVNKFLRIPNPRGRSPWTVIYTREGETKDVIVVHENTLVSRSYFEGRLHVLSDAITIDDVESRDAGTFKFKDSDGNLAQTVHVRVPSGEQLYTLVL